MRERDRSRGGGYVHCAERVQVNRGWQINILWSWVRLYLFQVWRSLILKFIRTCDCTGRRGPDGKSDARMTSADVREAMHKAPGKDWGMLDWRDSVKFRCPCETVHFRLRRVMNILVHVSEAKDNLYIWWKKQLAFTVFKMWPVWIDQMSNLIRLISTLAQVHLDRLICQVGTEPLTNPDMLIIVILFPSIMVILNWSISRMFICQYVH